MFEVNSVAESVTLIAMIIVTAVIAVAAVLFLTPLGGLTIAFAVIRSFSIELNRQYRSGDEFFMKLVFLGI